MHLGKNQRLQASLPPHLEVYSDRSPQEAGSSDSSLHLGLAPLVLEVASLGTSQQLLLALDSQQLVVLDNRSLVDLDNLQPVVDSSINQQEQGSEASDNNSQQPNVSALLRWPSQVWLQVLRQLQLITEGRLKLY